MPLALGQGTLQFIDLLLFGVPFLQQALEVGHGAAVGVHEAIFAVLLRLESPHFGPQSIDLSAIHGSLAVGRRLTHLERLILQPDCFLHPRIPAVRKQFPGIVHGSESVALRSQASFLCDPTIELPPKDFELGTGLGIVQGCEHLVLLHGVPVMHIKRANDPALKMLDGFAIVLDGDDAGSQGGTHEGGQRGPGSESAEDHQHERQPLQADRTIVAQQRTWAFQQLFSHRTPYPFSSSQCHATSCDSGMPDPLEPNPFGLARLGGCGGLAIAARTSSRGP